VDTREGSSWSILESSAGLCAAATVATSAEASARKQALMGEAPGGTQICGAEV